MGGTSEDPCSEHPPFCLHKLCHPVIKSSASGKLPDSKPSSTAGQMWALNLSVSQLYHLFHRGSPGDLVGELMERTSECTRQIPTPGKLSAGAQLVSSIVGSTPLWTANSFLQMGEMSANRIFSSVLYSWEEERLGLKPSPACHRLSTSLSLPLWLKSVCCSGCNSSATIAAFCFPPSGGNKKFPYRISYCCAACSDADMAPLKHTPLLRKQVESQANAGLACFHKDFFYLRGAYISPISQVVVIIKKKKTSFTEHLSSVPNTLPCTKQVVGST